MDSVEMAKLRWKGIKQKDRSAEMSRVALEGWKKRRKNKRKASARIDKVKEVV